MKKRFSKKAKTEYLNTLYELKRHREIEKLFKKFDDDGSGTLDANEL